MTKKEARIEKLLSRWKPRLMLDNWAILIEYADANKPATDAGTTLAEIVVNPTYTEARITIYPVFFTEPYGQQVSSLVHELCHLHTHKLQTILNTLVKHKLMTAKAATETHEAFTEQLSKMIIRSYKRGKKNGNYHL